MSMFDDVGVFHYKFGLPVTDETRSCEAMSPEHQEYRIKFLQEELDEFVDACKVGDLAGQLDALVDLAWVAMGTAHYLGAPFNEAWDEVVIANLKKIRVAVDPAKAYRGTGAVVKPDGWQSPRIERVIADHNARTAEPPGWRHDPKRAQYDSVHEPRDLRAPPHYIRCDYYLGVARCAHGEGHVGAHAVLPPRKEKPPCPA